MVRFVLLGDQIREAWMVTGDFNNILSTDERIGSTVMPHEFKEFQECASYNHLSDIKYKGCFYTWRNKQKRDDRIYCFLE